MQHNIVVQEHQASLVLTAEAMERLSKISGWETKGTWGLQHTVRGPDEVCEKKGVLHIRLPCDQADL
jgi:hypothetical protein